MPRLITSILFLCSGLLWAQHGIGTSNPSNSAALDIVASNKGILIPRVGLIASNTLAPLIGTAGSAHNGMLAYNASNTIRGEGFYYYDWNPTTNSGSWRKIAEEEGATQATQVGHNLDLNGDGDYSDVGEYVYRTYGIVTSPVTGKVWLDRDIGATRVSTGVNDIPSNNTQTPHGYYYVWTDALKACPVGYRLPTKAEWDLEAAGFAANGGANHIGAYNVLKLLRSGYIQGTGGWSPVNLAGNSAFYYSSTRNGAEVWSLNFSSIDAQTNSDVITDGHSIRCIRN